MQDALNGLQNHAEDEEARPHRVGHTSRVQPRVDVGQAEHTQRPHEHEEQASHDRNPAQCIERHVHHSASRCTRRVNPRSPNSKNFRTAIVPMKLISA